VPGIAGIELMNEPTEGIVPPQAFELSELYPFYRRMIAVLRAAGETRPIWFEPSILRDVTDDARAAAVSFSADPQLVYAVHIYTDVFSPPFSPGDSRTHLTQSFSNAQTEASRFGTPWVDDEFGDNAGQVWNGWLQNELDLQDQFLVGSAFWVWHQKPGFYDWETVNLDGSLRYDSLRAQQLSRPRVDAVPGRLLSTVSTPQRLDATIDGPGGTATFWGGTLVLRGGSTLQAAALQDALVDGRPVLSACTPVAYSTAVVSLRACRVDVAIPAGKHTVTLLPAAPSTSSGAAKASMSVLPNTAPSRSAPAGVTAVAVMALGAGRVAVSRRRRWRVGHRAVPHRLRSATLPPGSRRWRSPPVPGGFR